MRQKEKNKIKDDQTSIKSKWTIQTYNQGLVNAPKTMNNLKDKEKRPGNVLHAKVESIAT